MSVFLTSVSASNRIYYLLRKLTHFEAVWVGRMADGIVTFGDYFTDVRKQGYMKLGISLAHGKAQRCKRAGTAREQRKCL